jgi:hypothetical protein
MPYVSTSGIRLAYERTGRGERVLLIMGQAVGGNAWSMYQVPALKVPDTSRQCDLMILAVNHRCERKGIRDGDESF